MTQMVMAADAASRCNVDVQVACAGADVPAADDMRQCIELAAEVAGRDIDGDVSVRVVDESEMQALNHAYRGKNQPTNVLAFPAHLDELPGLPEDSARLLGDVLICAPVVAREAGEQGKTCAAHWDHMLVHGMLHLLGYDHETDTEAREMEALEIDALSRRGIENPYKINRLT